jgi:hypothetical protein
VDRLEFEAEEILREESYASPQVEAGQRLHGGFDAEGRYRSPRMACRGPALAAWSRSLREQGGDIMETDSSLLAGIRYPSAAQSKLLLQEELGQTFWNVLTVTGRIEGRGRILADMKFPDLQDVVVEDIGATALGHLNKGLLAAHGLDEGGELEKGIGGHDAMWFALRDLAFGDVDYPEPEVPDNIGRPEAKDDKPARISTAHNQFIEFLLNLLLIEFRAERGFALTESLLRDPELFAGRRTQAEHAAVIVDRIRQDETVHVDSLRLYLGELQHLHLRTLDGEIVQGREIVDPFWQTLVHWATQEQPRLAAQQQRVLMQKRIARHPEAERVQKAFDALEERPAAPAP